MRIMAATVFRSRVKRADSPLDCRKESIFILPKRTPSEVKHHSGRCHFVALKRAEEKHLPLTLPSPLRGASERGPLNLPLA